MATLQLQNLRKTYDTLEVIKGVDLEISDQEFVVFVGPSGCGKSTLLRMIAGLEEITSGDLMIDGEKVNDVPPAERGLAMVFQSYALYPHMSVADNMAFALRLAGVSKSERMAKVGEAAKVLQLEEYLDRKPRALSGGGNASGSPSGAPSCATRRCSCSTSRCQTWTPPCACKCASNWRGCTITLPPP